METLPKKTAQKSFFKSTTARLIIVALLILALLLPLTYVKKLISERKYRQESVVNEINQKWGNDILLYGPILKIPYVTYTKTEKFIGKSKTYVEEIETNTKYAYFFPENLTVNGNLEAKPFNRGNYKSVVYESEVSINGNFSIPDFATKEIAEKDILWNKATVLIETGNLKGIKNEVQLQLGANTYAFETNFNTNKDEYNNFMYPELESTYIKKEDVPINTKKDFNITLAFNGSEQFGIIPIGKTTTAKLTSNWSSPSFNGNFLPNDSTKQITPKGFTADWKVLHINRSFSQQYFNKLPNLDNYAFSAHLLIPVNEYQQSMRSVKYGYLVIGLTFLIFFLIQTMSKIYIHPFQYIMIGLALVMFYTLLISISEHSSFLKGYLIAGISVISVIALYTKSILKSFKFSGFIATSLTILYSFIYVIIQLENYALLVGSVGLFIILTTIMFASRKIDWSTN